MTPLHEIILRLSVAAALGAAIGIERNVHRRPGGIRTSMFVCLGSALFTVLSGEIAHRLGDTSGTRIASNLVQGIGFLGAGAILRENGGGLVGLTTAATIFLEAAIGMAAGGGLFAVAGYSTGAALFGLIVIGWLEHKFHLKPRIKAFRITAPHSESVGSDAQRLLTELKVKVQHFRLSMAGQNSIVEFNADISEHQEQQILPRLSRQGFITEVTPLEGNHE
jgi:uncharacterized membrane protein YhiD involved in acid resistance